jgi:hypothetical protein
LIEPLKRHELPKPVRIVLAGEDRLVIDSAGQLALAGDGGNLRDRDDRVPAQPTAVRTRQMTTIAPVRSPRNQVATAATARRNTLKTTTDSKWTSPGQIGQ